MSGNAQMYSALVGILRDADASADGDGEASLSLLRAVRRFKIEHELGTFAPLTSRRAWHSAWADVVVKNAAAKLVAVRPFLRLAPMLDELQRVVARGLKPPSVVPGPKVVARLASVKAFGALGQRRQAARAVYAAGRQQQASVPAYVRCIVELETVGVGAKRAADVRDCDDLGALDDDVLTLQKRPRSDGAFRMDDLMSALLGDGAGPHVAASWPPSAGETRAALQ